MPSGRVQVKPDCEGCNKRQISETQHSEKRENNSEVLSCELSQGQDPRRSAKRSKTVLKSPHKSVGTEGSTKSAHSIKKSSPVRVSIRGVQRTNTEDKIRTLKFSHKGTTRSTRPGLNEGEARTKEHDHTTRFVCPM